jgi:uncharacterized protein with LGFP repeats
MRRSARPLVLALTVALAAGGWWQGADGAQSAVSRAQAAEKRPHPVAAQVQDLAIPSVERRSQGLAASSLPRKMMVTAQLVAHLRTPLADGSSMVGITWSRDADDTDLDLRLRTRDSAGWTPWATQEFDPDEGPATDEEQETRDGTPPAWVGDADAIEIAVYSPTRAPRDLRVEVIDPGSSSYDATATAAPDSDVPTAIASQGQASATSSLSGTFPSIPDIVTRRQWGADNSLGDACFSPRVGTTFKMVFVHHTVNSNDYTRAESAAIVRGIYAYHTQSRGWCDIGYNFLVDRYGTTYEGRAGGIRRAVRGAHAGDYNVDTTGISLIGSFETTTPTSAMKGALVDLIAWRMGTAYHGAYGRVGIEGARFARIAGHRDAMSTACPGQRVYDWMPRLRERVGHRLGDYESKIERLWRSRGGVNSSFGAVRVGERKENQGRHTTFQDGRIYSSSAGEFVLEPGPILTRYLRSGETGSAMRYPASGVRSPRDGYAADFQGGSILWSKATGSVFLARSAVLQRYRAEHGAFGQLGFPTTRLRTSTDSAVAYFQYGTITYDKATKRTKVTYE